MRLKAFGTVLVLALLLGACGDSTESTETAVTTNPVSGPILSVTNARIGMPAGTEAALYFTIENSGDQDATLIGISVSVASMTMLHEVVSQDGLSKMREIAGGIVVPAGSSVTFEPGGMHAMMMGLSEMSEGLEADVEFKFAEISSITAMAEVVSLMSLSE